MFEHVSKAKHPSSTGVLEGGGGGGGQVASCLVDKLMEDQQQLSFLFSR